MSRKKVKSHWLHLVVLSGNDGLVTTFAVVSGVAGAKLGSSIILILGFANIAADALSMAIGNYLGQKTEKQLLKAKKAKIDHDQETGFKDGLIIFTSFAIGGLIPLIPYIFSLIFSGVISERFNASIISTALGLFLLGSARTFFIKGNWLKNGLEILAVGALAAIAAYSAGYLANSLVS